MRATSLSALGLTLLGLLALASPALAADRVYFGSNSTVSYANLDGSGVEPRAVLHQRAKVKPKRR
jgi:hypothetical protein